MGTPSAWRVFVGIQGLHAMTDVSFPAWLQDVSVISLSVGFACAVLISIDELRRPQKMWIMNLVWPLTSLFGSIIWLGLYLAWGRTSPHRESVHTPSFAIQVAKGSSHCGAGCTLGDIIGEWSAFVFPGIAELFGWHSLFADKTFAVWIFDFVLALLFGVGFQYFTIAPMRNVSWSQGLVAALKADTASIAGWQIGMYGVMALVQFGWYRGAFGHSAPVASVEFWFAMQIAMVAGFLTSYPVNWWLLRKGVKEAM